jgi:hypothetical protein
MKKYILLLLFILFCCCCKSHALELEGVPQDMTVTSVTADGVTVDTMTVNSQVDFPAASIDGADIKNNEITSTQLANSIDISSGTVGGTNAENGDNYTGAGVAPILFLNKAGANAGISVTTWKAAGDAASWLAVRKSDNATEGTHAALEAGEDIGGILFNASDGTNFECSGAIFMEAGAQMGSNDVPGDMVFLTTADGAAVPTERMRIEMDGEIVIPGTVTVNNSVFSESFDHNFEVIEDTDGFTVSSAQVGSTLVVDADTQSTTIVLPTAIGIEGQEITFVVFTTGTYTLDGNGSEQINGATTSTLMDAAYDSLTIRAVGLIDSTTYWFITGSYIQ